MLLKALDLLRRLGWGIINFIYNLIDTLFDVLKSLNAFVFSFQATFTLSMSFN